MALSGDRLWYLQRMMLWEKYTDQWFVDRVVDHDVPSTLGTVVCRLFARPSFACCRCRRSLVVVVVVVDNTYTRPPTRVP